MKVEDYSEQSRIYLSELAETLNPQIRHSFSDVAANIGDYLQQSRNYLSQKMGDYLPQGKEYLSALAVKAEGLIATQWENLKQADLIPTSQDDRANHRSTDFPGLQSNNDQGPAIEEPGSMTDAVKPSTVERERRTDSCNTSRGKVSRQAIVRKRSRSNHRLSRLRMNPFSRIVKSLRRENSRHWWEISRSSKIPFFVTNQSPMPQ